MPNRRHRGSLGRDYDAHVPSTLTLRQASPAKTRADLVVVGILDTPKGPTVAPGGEDVAAALGRRWQGLLSSMGVKGKSGEITKVPTGGDLNSPLMLLVGLGSTADLDAIRTAAGTASRSVNNTTSVAVALPATTPEEIAAATAGWLLGSYRFTRYRKESPADTDVPGTVSLLSPVARQGEATAAFGRAEVLARAVIRIRDLVNTPPADLTPPAFADQVVTDLEEWRTDHGKGLKKAGAALTLTVFDDTELAELGCGGILAVGAGSAAAPRMVKLQWQPREPIAHLALVGKGVTFDSGGLSIKPASGMSEMKSDMAGAATVLQATLVIAQLGLPVAVTAWAPMAENMVSGSSFRPGDVLRMQNGTTVEIQNTDAEGRLLLADALAMATAEEPDVVLDVATLTGHMVMALGNKVTGVLGDDHVVADVLRSAETAGESMWPMPITDEMSTRLKASRIADLKQHDWVRWGGGLFAAAFLREFTDARPWAHLDIAGPSYNSGGASGHLTHGGTGVGLTTLVQFAEDLVASRS